MFQNQPQIICHYKPSMSPSFTFDSVLNEADSAAPLACVPLSTRSDVCMISENYQPHITSNPVQ